jgi:hypothetical protein
VAKVLGIVAWKVTLTELSIVNFILGLRYKWNCTRNSCSPASTSKDRLERAGK